MLASVATFGRERQIQPHRHIGGCELRTDGCVTLRRKGPVERRANVVDFLSGVGQPSTWRWRHGPSFRASEEIAVVLGMAARDPFALVARIKLLEHIGPGRIEQPEPRPGAAD